MGKYHKLKEALCRELEDIERKGELSAGDLEAAQKLTDTIKNIDKIGMLEEAEYSQAGDWSADTRGSYGNSYARGHYVRAHYSRDDGNSYNGNSYGRYSRDGYSRDGLKDRLGEMMGEASNDREREALRRCMESL